MIHFQSGISTQGFVTTLRSSYGWGSSKDFLLVVTIISGRFKPASGAVGPMVHARFDGLRCQPQVVETTCFQARTRHHAKRFYKG